MPGDGATVLAGLEPSYRSVHAARRGNGLSMLGRMLKKAASFVLASFRGSHHTAHGPLCPITRCGLASDLLTILQEV
jgi:hypothetical protein